MTLMARDLVARPLSGASLWVLRENVGARRFYERLGGTVLAEKAVTEGAATMHEVAYGWADLSDLI